jgi:hypothetical protein
MKHGVDRLGVAAGTQRSGSSWNPEIRPRTFVASWKWPRRPRGRWPGRAGKDLSLGSREMPHHIRCIWEDLHSTHSAHSLPCALTCEDALIGPTMDPLRPDNMDRTPRSVRADRQAVDRCSAHPTPVMAGFQEHHPEHHPRWCDGRPEQQSFNVGTYATGRLGFEARKCSVRGHFIVEFRARGSARPDQALRGQDTGIQA